MWVGGVSLVAGLCTGGIVHCDAGNHYFPTVIWLLILRTSVLSILLGMLTCVLWVEIPRLLLSGGTVRRSQLRTTAAMVAHIALGNVLEAEPRLWTHLCRSWKYQECRCVFKNVLEIDGVGMGGDCFCILFAFFPRCLKHASFRNSYKVSFSRCLCASLKTFWKKSLMPTLK